MARFNDIRGAIYMPFYAWNAFQMWRFYDREVIERDLQFAKQLGLNSLRVLLSYEFWYLEASNDRSGNNALERLNHFINTCQVHGIKPLFVMFESPPERDPTVKNRLAPRPSGGGFHDAGGVRSPAHWGIGLYPFSLVGFNWSNAPNAKYSPMHFTRRLANEFGKRKQVLAWELMNEPWGGDTGPAMGFLSDISRAWREETNSGALTIGSRTLELNKTYEQVTSGRIDIHQFHHNLPPHRDAARDKMREAGRFNRRFNKPLWYTEWQRTREEPPSRFMPNYSNMADIVWAAQDNGWIDGNYFWGLMMQPAYLRGVRNKGRYNGLYFPGGEVFDLTDARAIARDPDLDIEQRHILPHVWRNHPFPYPEPQRQPRAQCSRDVDCMGPQECERGTCVPAGQFDFDDILTDPDTRNLMAAAIAAGVIGSVGWSAIEGDLNNPGGFV